MKIIDCSMILLQVCLLHQKSIRKKHGENLTLTQKMFMQRKLSSKINVIVMAIVKDALSLMT